MEDSLDARVPEWLGLTPQQYDIMQCIFRLQSENIQASPKAIQGEYRKLTGKYLMKPNLFNILRSLKRGGCITQSGFGAYVVDFEGVSGILHSSKEELKKTMADFDRLTGDLEDYFNRTKINYFKPTVEYLDHTPFFEKIGFCAKRSNAVYAAGKFANILYTPRLLESVDRGGPFRTIYDRCIVKKELKVTYITMLDVEYLYRHALRCYHDPVWAYKECEMVLDNVMFLARSKNLDIIYLNPQPGLQMVCHEGHQGIDVFMYIRDNSDEIVGGVYINSPDIGKRAKETFLRECLLGTNLKSKKGETILRNTRKELKEKFSGRHK
ncbi:MAG: hypothetical protein V1875_02745 [Candidatus Altiarchaeota archaeon]